MGESKLRRLIGRTKGLALLSAVLALPTTVTYGKTVCDTPAGTLIGIEGSVEVKPADAFLFAAIVDRQLCEGDMIRVGPHSRASISLANNVILRLDEDTDIRLVNAENTASKGTLVELITGALQSLSQHPWQFKVTTPHVDADVDGTEFVARVDGSFTRIFVFDGHVDVSNSRGRLSLHRGEAAEATSGTAPLRIHLEPQNAVQWALYYPSVLQTPSLGHIACPGSVQNNDASKSDRTGGCPAPFQSADRSRQLILAAAQLIKVGRIPEADKMLTAALAILPTNVDALALQSIIALTQNQRNDALRLTARAVGLAPNNASALLALSYAEQAQFDLDAALRSARRATESAPENALTWARLAESFAAIGLVDKAHKAALKAVAIDSTVARSQTILGFTQLFRETTALATKAFQRAIALDPADPLPRLGLGLAKIKSGQVASGRHELEVAVNLSSNNAMLRSYLGKAYFEEKRTALAEREFAQSAVLDPKDPTPFFYSAIAKQTTNRPIEALDDLLHSISLNDNRAVYRSRLLLDSDVAAKTASAGRIFANLGFEQLALRAGWQSVTIDPADYAGHRLLADAYGDLSRHEIARVSELLQSQLLQPVTTTPIQPLLAEGNLYLQNPQGPTKPSFNEFNPVFTTDRLALQSNMLIATQATHAAEVIVSGIHGNTSFSVSGVDFHTDGFRTNADQSQRLADGYIQSTVANNLSLQGEYRHRETTFGDLQQRFFKEDFFSKQRNIETSDIYRIGAKYDYAPDTIVLGSLMLRHTAFQNTTNDFPDRGDVTKIDSPATAASAEFQALHFDERYSTVTGLGFATTHRRDDIVARSSGPDASSTQTTGRTDTRHFNVYEYLSLKPTHTFTSTLGISMDVIDNDVSSETHQFNPKLGISWKPWPETTLRAAVFRVLKRTLVTDQTVEPTHIVGFNQFYDDLEFSKSWRYGVAIDQKLSSQSFGGIELSARDLRVPLFAISNQTAREVPWSEYSAGSYLFWTPHSQLALRTVYRFERLFRSELGAGIRELDTHRLQFGANWFHPSGFSGSISLTYWNQNGLIESFIDNPPLRSAADNHWSVDTAIAYRLPKRYGYVQLGATNLLNQDFNFFDTDINNVTIQPTRLVYMKVLLAWP